MQTVLITGASSGIGKAFAYEFAKRGYHLIITSRRKELLDRIAEELTDRYKIGITVIPQDLSEEHSAKRLVSEINSRNLQIDIIENIMLLTVLNRFPIISERIIHISSIATGLKLLMIKIWAVIFIVGILWGIVKKREIIAKK